MTAQTAASFEKKLAEQTQWAQDMGSDAAGAEAAAKAKNTRRLLENGRAATFDSDEGSVSILNALPKGVELDPSHRMDEDSKDNVIAALERDGAGAAASGVFAYLHRTVDRCVRARGLGWSEEKRAANEDSLARLREIVGALLGTDLEIDDNGVPYVFGRPLVSGQLSNGQRVLLQLAVVLHANGPKYDGAILALDEPENHLHPAALVQALNRLRRVVTTGQIWIATHSVPLLASLPPEAIWYVEQGRVSHVGPGSETVLRGLIGDDDGIARLADFLSSPAVFAMVRFAHQCLLEPGVAAHVEGDPQTNQIANALSAVRASHTRPLRVLDIGAGNGRLIEAIHGIHGAKTSNLIEYQALEQDLTRHPDLHALVALADGDRDVGGRTRVFGKWSELGSVAPGEIDVVVMCNVLHEIEPREWIQRLGPQSELRRVLGESGQLLLVEDQRMPVGERAHRLGFVVLHEAAVRRLFAVTGADEFVVEYDAHHSARRLSAFLLPARLLDRVTQATLMESLRQVQNAAKERIDERRKMTSRHTYRDGREHALDVQLFANARLALQDFGEP